MLRHHMTTANAMAALRDRGVFLLTGFNHIGQLALAGQEDEAAEALIAASECDEVGLGSSRTRKGKRIGRDKANEVLAIFRRVPHYATHGLIHIEEFSDLPVEFKIEVVPIGISGLDQLDLPAA